MYCEECKVYMGYTTDACPLCGKSLGKDIELKNPIYPRRDAHFRFPLKYTFTRFYSVTAIILIITMLTINLIFHWEVFWVFVLGAALIYLYVLIRHTIMTSYGSAVKILMQGVTIAIVMLIIQRATNSGTWAYDYGIPILLTINTLVLWASAIIRKIRRATYTVALIIISIIDAAPALIFISGYSSVLWTALMALFTAIVTALFVLILFSKHFLSEIKRILHF